MFWREQGVGGETVVRFTGVLDATSARNVNQFLNTDPTGMVILDFSQAEGVDYYGLSVLVSELAHIGRPVLLRGLDYRHVRMLKYFGIDPADFGISDSPRLDVG